MSNLVTSLERRLLALSETKRVDRIKELIADNHFESAIHEINALNSEITLASRACSGLATVINKRHWSPLLEVQS